DEWLFEEDADILWDEIEVDDSYFEDVGDDADTQISEGFAQIEEDLLGAMEVYSWFMLCPLDIDPEKPDSTGQRYQVLDERFNTTEQLRDFVSQFFSDAIVDDLFAMDIYVEGADGYLYTTDEGRNIDETIGETEFELTESSDTRMVYTVVVNYWTDDEQVEQEQFTYVRELIDDHWKFTEFPFYW
ncbi:MAG: hypothetical protein Q4D04_15995, partial [Clostridia bacterium]|nr:hypothetical protein [Clostridia bacterium]